MSLDEIEQIIGREADSTFETGTQAIENAIFTWRDGNTFIDVVIADGLVYSTNSGGIGGSNYHVGIGQRHVLPAIQDDSINWSAFFIIMSTVLLPVPTIYLIYWLINKTKPKVSRNVRIVKMRRYVQVSGVRVMFAHLTGWLVTFEDAETGLKEKKRIPHRDKWVFYHMSVGDEGVLIMQGALYVSFQSDKLDSLESRAEQDSDKSAPQIKPGASTKYLLITSNGEQMITSPGQIEMDLLKTPEGITVEALSDVGSISGIQAFYIKKQSEEWYEIFAYQKKVSDSPINAEVGIVMNDFEKEYTYKTAAIGEVKKIFSDFIDQQKAPELMKSRVSK